MKRNFFISLFILLSSCFQDCIGQSAPEQAHFDSIFNQIATEIASEDKSKAISMAKGLLEQSGTRDQKIKGMMLLATLYDKTGDYVHALDYALQADQIAGKAGNKDWELRISGFLSTTFRNAGLFSEGRIYLEKTEYLVKNIKNKPLFQMFLHQEKAHYEINERNWSRALSESLAAVDFYSQLPAQNASYIFEGTNQYLVGICYLNLNQFDSSEFYLLKARNTVQERQTELKDFIYQSLADLYIHKGSYHQALPLLDSALKYTEGSHNLQAKALTYKGLFDYYHKTGDEKKAVFYQQRYLDIMENYVNNSNKLSNFLIDKYNLKVNNERSKYSVLMVVCIVLVTIIIAVTAYFIYNRKKQRQKSLNYIWKFQREEKGIQNDGPDPAEHQQDLEPTLTVYTGRKNDLENEISNENIRFTLDNGSLNNISINIETEQRILNSLKLLEEEGFYLENNMSLSLLASKLGTNTKYTSFVINKYYKKDYSSYINELRIDYIIRKLHEDPQYLEFKIAALAEESGFSSHSKFTSIFKMITGISPSSYIRNIKKDAS